MRPSQRGRASDQSSARLCQTITRPSTRPGSGCVGFNGLVVRSWSAGAFSRLSASAGVHVMASSNDVSSETVIVTASARKKLPVTPDTATSGRKTTTGVMVDPTRGREISCSALRTAATLVSPASRCRTMFSTTTIASSMTRPMAAARPPRVIRLKLSPMIHSMSTVTATVTGITRPATIEERQSRRKR